MVVVDWGRAKADFTDTVIVNAALQAAGGVVIWLSCGHRDIGVIYPLERNTGRPAGRLYETMEEALINTRCQTTGLFRATSEPGIRLPRDAAANFIAVIAPTAVFCGGGISGDGRAAQR